MPRDYQLETDGPSAHQRLPEYTKDELWIRSFLRTARIGHVATLWDDQPFVMPTMFWFDEAKHRIIFHSNLTGRIRANAEHNSKVCLEASDLGRLLPSNVALEFSLQYRSVLVFGNVRVLESNQEKQDALYGLIEKYFPGMRAGNEYRPTTEKELKRTSVYQIQIQAWSGKENWKDYADQSNEWPALDEKWFKAF